MRTNITLRMKKCLHARLSERAKTDGVSLNALINKLLEDGLARETVTVSWAVSRISAKAPGNNFIPLGHYADQKRAG